MWRLLSYMKYTIKNFDKDFDKKPKKRSLFPIIALIYCAITIIICSSSILKSNENSSLTTIELKPSNEENARGIFLDDDNETDSNSTFPININTASESDLQALRGIGDVLSKRITEYRNSNGAFTSIEQIKKVKGIGNKTFDDIKDYICVK